MTRDDIVRLWDEANNWGIPIRSGLVEELERFAALVAAAEREAFLALCKQHAEEYTTYYQHAAAGACEALAQAIAKRGKE